uniref:Ig-like domain-containing protein n=1 Tax=Plectus sambesii TaxID=2011161 RepID=A0A914UKJ6_9BILA
MLCGHRRSSVAVVGALLLILAESVHAVVPGQQRRATYKVPTEGQQVIFNCSQEGMQSVDYWILPDGSFVDVHSAPVDGNYRIGDRGELIVMAVKPGMDGTYACERKADDGTLWRMEFLIPYIITNVDYTYSFLISLSLSIVFAAACIIIMLVDKYRWRVKEQKTRKRTRTARKSRVSEMEHSAGASSFVGAFGQTNPAFSNDCVCLGLRAKEVTTGRHFAEQLCSVARPGRRVTRDDLLSYRSADGALDDSAEESALNRAFRRRRRDRS